MDGYLAVLAITGLGDCRVCLSTNILYLFQCGRSIDLNRARKCGESFYYLPTLTSVLLFSPHNLRKLAITLRAFMSGCFIRSEACSFPYARRFENQRTNRLGVRDADPRLRICAGFRMPGQTPYTVSSNSRLKNETPNVPACLLLC
ncbi:hypothetical protein BDV41DRAFT_514292 [Aspergillus transmontanensis]|uniref:Uncharacterized protein n=1 Tax=Aspergillus transmontanensis TaxID=1034304 RepID=A0A5N6VJ43_9EURO|nr:hypothetical protein BDV41DRAFT_514292 [Aspergillus transmontanensis]